MNSLSRQALFELRDDRLAVRFALTAGARCHRQGGRLGVGGKIIGFMRIAETRFVFRDQLKVNPYRDEKSV